MFVYQIPMQLRFAEEDTNYSSLLPFFEQAGEEFNLRAQKLKKAREITSIECREKDFVVTLKSKDELTNPSKALNVFSQELAKLEELSKFKEGNHLLSNSGLARLVEGEEKAFDDSTGEVLKLIIDIFMGGSVQDDVFVITGRRDAQKAILAVCRKYARLKEEGNRE